MVGQKILFDRDDVLKKSGENSLPTAITDRKVSIT
jgi:hypothetical protein